MNKYRDMTPAQLEAELALIQQAQSAVNARRKVAAAFMLKEALKVLADDAGEAFNSIAPQAFPRPANLAKPADLSETEISAIRKTVEGFFPAL